MHTLVESLRSNFQKKYAGPLARGEYHTQDVDRLLTSDKYAEAFIRHQKSIVAQAADMCHRAFKWRKEYGLNDLTDASFSDELLRKGAIFFRNHDKDGNPIMYFKIKDHKKNPATLPIIEKYMVYLMDREDKRLEGRRIVVLFDMSGAGLGNLDLDLIKFLITCFEEYFPDYLAYLLVYDMQWILNAAWKIIRAWLSAEAKKKVIFVRGQQVFEYVDKENLFLHMGGFDNYTFKYEPVLISHPEPEPQPQPQPQPQPEQNQNQNHLEDDNASTVASSCSDTTLMDGSVVTATSCSDTTLMDGSVVTATSCSDTTLMDGSVVTATSSSPDTEPKHVTFSHEDPTVFTSLLNESELKSEATSSLNLNANNYLHKRGTSRKRSSAEDDSIFVETLITIKPGNELVFTQHESANQKESMYQAWLQVTNPRTDLRTAYKVKTTSPNKYKVRPSLGLIKPGQTINIIVYLTSSSHEVSKDKFLVMALGVEDGFISSGELAEMWKTAPKDDILEHRLRCSMIEPVIVEEQNLLIMAGGDRLTEFEKHIISLNERLDDVVTRNRDLERQILSLSRTQRVMIILFVCFCLAILVTTYHRKFGLSNTNRSRPACYSCLHP